MYFNKRIFLNHNFRFQLLSKIWSLILILILLCYFINRSVKKKKFSWRLERHCRKESDPLVKGTDPSSVADPGCLSRIPDPDFYPSRIPDFGSRIQKQQQKIGVKKICCHNFLCSHKFHKIANYFSFEVLKKKIWASFHRMIYFLPKKLTLSSQKYGFGIRDPGSGKNQFRSRTLIDRIYIFRFSIVGAVPVPRQTNRCTAAV